MSNVNAEWFKNNREISLVARFRQPVKSIGKVFGEFWDTNEVQLLVTADELEDIDQSPAEGDYLPELPVPRMHSCELCVSTPSFQALTRPRFSQSQNTNQTLTFCCCPLRRVRKTAGEHSDGNI